MPGKAAKVPLSEKQLDILRQIVRQSTASVCLAQRCRIILLGFEGRLNEDIAAVVNLHRRYVGVWRRRWQQSFEALIAIECSETAAALRQAIEDVLSDAPRPGSPGTLHCRAGHADHRDRLRTSRELGPADHSLDRLGNRG